jgi:hypothetical protein
MSLKTRKKTIRIDSPSPGKLDKPTVIYATRFFEIITLTELVNNIDEVIVWMSIN